jgi:hypothetical protein
MDQKQRLDAIKDILTYWRQPGHRITHGRELASELDVGWQREEHDYRLAERLRDALAEEIERLRESRLGEESTRAGSVSAAPGVGQSVPANKQQLLELLAVWDYYIRGMEAADLAPGYGIEKRAMLDRIKRGREVIAANVVRWKHKRMSAGADGEARGEDSGSAAANGFARQCETAPHNCTVLESDIDGMEASPATAWSSQSIQRNSANTLLVINGDRPSVSIIAGGSGEGRYPSETSRANGKQDLDRLQAAGVALFMLLTMWLAFRAPHISVSTMLLLAGWRAGTYAVCAIRTRRRKQDEETGWNVFAMLAWLTLVGLAAVLALRLPLILAAPLYSHERLGLVLRALCIGAGMLLLGLIDTLFWIHRSAPVWGPWRLLRSHAARAYEHRWEAIGLGWVTLIVLGLAYLMAGAL